MRLLTPLWAAGLLLRRLRSEAGIVLLIAVLVGATAFVFAAAPRLFNRAADDALRFAAERALPLQRDIALNMDAAISPGGGGVDGPREQGEELTSGIAPSITRLVGSESMRITAARMPISGPPKYETRLLLSYVDGLPDQTRLVEGRWPASLGQPLAVRELGVPVTGPLPDPVIVEAAVAKAAADETGLKVGGLYSVSLEGADGLIHNQRVALQPTQIRVVGIYEPVDATALFWSGQDDLLRAVQHGNDDAPIAWVAAYISPDTYPDLFASTLRFHYTWRLNIDPARFDAGNADQLQVDLQRLGLIGNANAAGTNQVTVITGLPGLVNAFTAQRAATQSTLSLAAVGPFGLAGGALAMVALLLAGRRRSALTLARGRGASGSLVLGTQLWESILIAGGAAILGYLAAVLAVPGPTDPVSLALAGAVGLGAILVLVGAAWPAARKPLGQLERDDAPVLKVPARRLVLEMTVVGIAIGAALLLRQRGLSSGSGDAASAVHGDPLLASVPALSGLAAGIVALRLYPVPVRALGWLAAKGRGFVPVVALRTVARHSAGANLPLLVLLLTAAFGTFASVVGTSIDRGQVAASYLDIGADYRLDNALGGVLPPSLDVARVDGVQAAAAGLIDSGARIGTTIGNGGGAIYLEVIDSAAYAAVGAGTAADPAWPSDYTAPFSPDGIGTAANPIPAILSTKLPTGIGQLPPGTTFQMEAARTIMTFRVVARRATFAGIDLRAPWAVVPLDQVKAAAGHFVAPTSYWVRGGDSVGAALAAAVEANHGNARVIARSDTYSRLHDAPLVRALSIGYALAVVLAAAYMAFTIIGSMVLSAARRTRDHAFLRTLGVSSGQRMALTLMEHAPPVLLGLLPGVALGVAIAILVEPGLGLINFVGGQQVPLFIDWPGLGVMIAALVATVVIAVAGGSWLASRARVADALRIGEH
ncbi:MAG TPA: FtsX-like permease family protein [Candidatus Limnocylindrales bacterium]|nr:FtsX-like permease family protein [Candidatus Limnocylindrales bacterium]